MQSYRRGRGVLLQVGLEAIIPVNRESGTGIGVLDQLAFLSRRNFPEEVRAAASRRRPGGVSEPVSTFHIQNNDVSCPSEQHHKEF
jgi:hypothetical protein